MKLEDEFKYLVGGYYGVLAMDEYDLKVYILKDIENYIIDWINDNPIVDYPYREKAEQYKEELSVKIKLQDALLVLPKVDAPMEIVFLIKHKLKEIKEEEMREFKKNNW